MTRFGLRGEILIAFALVTLFAIGLNTVVVLQLDGLLQRRERLETAESSAELAAAALGNDPDETALAAVLGRIPDLIAAEVVDVNGEVRFHTGTPPADSAVETLAARLFGETRAKMAGLLVEGGQILSVVTPTGNRDRPTGALVVWRRVGAGGAASRHARQLTILYVALDALVAGSFGWYLVARMVVRPLTRLADATRRVTEGDLSVRLPAASGNELGMLARDFNRMAATLSEKESELARQLVELQNANLSLKAAREEVLQSEKLASVGRLAAGVAHELGNPVGAVTGYVSVMLRGRLEEVSEDAEMLRRIDREMKRVDRIIRDLLDYARPRTASPEPIDLDATVEAALAIVSVQKSFKAIEVERLRGAAPSKIVGDAHRLQQVVVNLLINAADATEISEKRRVVVETFRGEFPAAPRARRREDVPAPSGPCAGLRVRDTGAGIAPDHLPMLFDPFFTTKDPGRGTGLGLAISRTIVESMGGRIFVESTEGKGSTFSVLLPLAP